ncbi:MAG: hypothetical protein EA394_08030 [Bacteroidia bacterium]|nr:MAG: hypothetical protein EA394_08030 [Bacteroidia bacterium]
MKVRSVNIPNARLLEGQIYPFRVIKTISLDEGDDYFVMMDPNGYKILMPAVFYVNYGMQPGDSVLCRVDKINCNGRMFLEPMHPHYREGKTYSFPIHCKGERENILGMDEWYFMVKDIFGQKWKVRTYSKSLWEKPPGELKCLVKRIKKGKLFLAVQGEEIKHPDLEAGQIYPFTIVDERLHPDDKTTYYILADKSENKHLLKKKYYQNYNLEIGQNILCRVDKFSTEGFYFLEPEHPCYRQGAVYSFPVDRLEELVFTDGFRQKVLVLRDCHGEEVKIHITDEEAAQYENMSEIVARVDRIRKSRLEVTLHNQIT